MIDARSLFLVEINVIITDFNSHLSFFISYYVFKKIVADDIIEYFFCTYTEIYETNLQRKDNIANNGTYDN